MRTEWLILVYPPGGGEPYEVWRFKEEDKFNERSRILILEGKAFIAFEAKVLFLWQGI